MKKISDLLNWVDIKDAEQLEWIKEYLQKHAAGRYFIQTNESNAEIGVYNLFNPFVESDLLLLINKMRAAWRQKKFRSKQNGKKTYSFIMSTKIEKKLKDLAGKGNVRELLETLISNYYLQEAPKIKELKDHNKELQSMLSLEKKDNLELKQSNKELNKKVETQDSEIANLEDKLKSLEQHYTYLSRDLGRLKQEYDTLKENKN